MGQKITTAQFYVYGKKAFTRTGWQKAQTGPAYQPPAYLEEVDLSGRVYLVTGANSGIGKELTQFLSRRRAKVYMVS
jgi:NADPH:quinone reductase-like Zn-dependent oxidoreductase